MNKYVVDKPYPSQESVKPNSRDLKLIFKDYAGLYSEFTAVSQYFYNHLYANCSGYEQIGRTIMQIAIAEMHHLDIFGELVINLGGDPKLVYPRDFKSNWWNGGIVVYKREIHEILQSAIELEKKAIECYEYHASIASQKIVSEILLRIVEDEKLHLKIFTDLLNDINE